MQLGQRIAYSLAATCGFKERRSKYLGLMLVDPETADTLILDREGWRFAANRRTRTELAVPANSGTYTQYGVEELAKVLGGIHNNRDDLMAVVEQQWASESSTPKAGHMAKTKEYSSIIDEMLDHGYEDADMDDSAKRGNELSDLTRDMAEDGFFSAHIATSPESSRTHISKKLSDDNVLNDVVISQNKAKSNKDGLEGAVNEKSLLSAIDKLLARGVPPSRIASAIAKCAEINLNNRQMSTNYLNSRANDLGMSYLQPNTFMPKRPDTYESQKPKLSGNNLERNMGQRNASVYITAEGEDLLSLNESKFGGQPSIQRRAVEIKIADRVEAKNNLPTIGRVPTEPTIRTAGDAYKSASARNLAEEFDSDVISQQHLAGKSFEQIWRAACKHAGLHIASKSFHEYISRAKQQGMKFASTDVTFLREKLGFRDIETALPKTAQIPRIAYDSGKIGDRALDGNELLKEFELSQTSAPVDIEINEESPLVDVEIQRSEINL